MVKASACNAGDPGSIPESGSSPGEGTGNPVLLPGKFHGWRNLVGYSPWGLKESDMTERLVYSKRMQFRNSQMEEMCTAKTYGERTRASTLSQEVTLLKPPSIHKLRNSLNLFFCDFYVTFITGTTD